jgi:hypothetical protein
VKTGRAPHYTELARILGVRPDEAGQVLILLLKKLGKEGPFWTPK